ncbi:MAG: hypothetical protein K2L32_01650 [Muribaculaceae bacterium]|nr:hypothetical protein [Muribaculaceae bacterium]
MKFLFITLALAAAALTAPAQALTDARRDSLMRSHKVLTFGGETESATEARNDSVRRLIEMFYYDQFRHFSDPEAPYFLLMSRDADLAMGIGGAVRMRGYYDWNGAMPSPAFTPFHISMHPDPARMRHFATTPSGCCLFFRVLGQNKTLGNYQLYIEAGFNGYDGRDLKLKKAYAIVNDFTVGLATSTFSDPAAQPPVIDAQGPSNKISGANVLVRWMPRLSARWIAALSAETPASLSASFSPETEAVENWIPDAAAFLQYEWGPTAHVRLAGIVRSLSYRDKESRRNRHTAGWGVMLSSVAHPLSPRLTTYASVNYGHGYAGLGGDLSMGTYDLIPCPGSDRRLYAPASLGWCAGAQWNFRHNLFASGAVSSTLFMPRRGVAGDEYRRGITADVNLIWNPTPRIQTGIEFDFAQRLNFSGDSHSACRINLLAQFSF